MTNLQYTEKKWIIAHNSNDVCHYIELEAGIDLTTGQPSVEAFDTFEECAERIVMLGFDLNKVIGPKQQSIEDIKLIAMAELENYIKSKNL